MARFEPLTLNNLPLVLVRMLALEPDEHVVLCGELTKAFGEWKAPSKKGRLSPTTLALWCVDILERSQKDRREAIPLLDGVFSKLHEQEFFGADGRNDPRGDHRA